MLTWIAGIDVGSTTVKAVVCPAAGGPPVWRDYRRHGARQAETVADFLRRIDNEFGPPGHRLEVVMTGSGAAGFAPAVGARRVSEVAAVAHAVEKLFPEAGSVVELGGQDAKIIFFEPLPGGGRKKTSTMNDVCAGGTGAVIDKIAAKLRIPEDQLAGYRYDGVPVHPVAGKCGVFAESDINSLQKKGVPERELFASLFEALVLQNLSVLSRGRLLRPLVLLLGGPNYYLPGLREAWRAHLMRLWRERGLELPAGASASELVRCPDDAVYFAALGAVELAREEGGAPGYRGAGALTAPGCLADTRTDGLPGLCRSRRELQEFLEQYRPPSRPERGFERGEKCRVFLGIDGGSTSTKAVLIDEWGAVRASAYCLSAGNPLHDCREIARELREKAERQGARIHVLGAAVTGYAKDVLARVLRTDAALVETAAHARSGLAVMPGVDVIVDVGGQDIKIITLHGPQVRDFMLNTQCSAGNGYFLQAVARSFGVSLEDYASRAFRARRMPRFTPGCAIFLQADIVNFQRQGWTQEEILAGLAAVLPRNIWIKVAKIQNPLQLGRRFLLQGGTQHNLAAVKAQVDYIRECARGRAGGVEIAVHPFCGEAGAIGAALEARDLWASGRTTQFPGLEAIEALEFRAESGEQTRCRFCQNACVRTFLHYDLCGERGRLIIANCEKGAAEDAAGVRRVLAASERNRRENPNLVALAARSCWRPAQRPPLVARPVPPLALTPRARLRARRSQIHIAIPRVTYQYIYANFFAAYLESLGVPAENILWSDFTSDAMYRAAMGRGAIDPCFPSKVAVAHIHNLLAVHFPRRPFQVIFMPMFDVLETHLENCIATNACPTVSTTPLVAHAAFRIGGDEFARRGIAFLRPLLDLRDRGLLERQMLECWAPVLGVDEEENAAALAVAHEAHRQWMEQMRAETRAVIEMLEQQRRLGIVILGRPYHHDPGLNHGIPEEFQTRGYPVLSQSFLPTAPDILERVFGGDHPLDIDDVWQHSYSASTTHKVWAAKFVARHPNLIGVELSNFRCGHDAPAYRLIQRILESAGRPYFGFKDLDENRPAGSIRLRVETIDYYLRRHRERLIGQRAAPERAMAAEV
ncbi:MAG: acyl-CoA dehydratase activase-related protein [Bryobacteraceae bacterium]|nr:acyl-CoA dehydratase activase-related protein [Bryobacteraceae bacterium]